MNIAQMSCSQLPSAASLATIARVDPQLVLCFGPARYLTDPRLLGAMREAMPGAQCVGCSEAGEIGADGVTEGQLVISALHFDHPGFGVATTRIDGAKDSFDAGLRLARALCAKEHAAGLHAVLVFAPGVDVNGSGLIGGLQAHLPAGVSISGGLAGDEGAFKETYTLSDQGAFHDQVVAVGFFSPQIQMSYGSFHGWLPFGPARQVTRSNSHVLYELDGAPALEVYKRYLGDYAKDLPASGLFFPFELLDEDRVNRGLIRTVLGVDEAAGSLTLAGDVGEGDYMRLMHASTDALAEGALAAARQLGVSPEAAAPSLALLVSCVGRKLVMGARVDDEVDAVIEVLGQHTRVAGFYSYGELCPQGSGQACQLHNQTMTITHIQELPAS
ncbi:MAG TPA: FIST N-terminal domain-containing protein [Burkholderiaceae bacterium]|nr:FIST N-terminal domain-containing protein [Burkholderiaceae bacterium]